MLATFRRTVPSTPTGPLCASLRPFSGFRRRSLKAQRAGPGNGVVGCSSVSCHLSPVPRWRLSPLGRCDACSMHSRCILPARARVTECGRRSRWGRNHVLSSKVFSFTITDTRACDGQGVVVALYRCTYAYPPPRLLLCVCAVTMRAVGFGGGRRVLKRER